MSIVVTTPTGNIGSVVTAALLDAGRKPVLIARDPSKLKAEAERGATVIQGDHGDAADLIAATRGAESLFVLVPGDMTVPDMGAFYRRYAEATAAAVKANGIGHVVLLSSAGAEKPSGTGPVAHLYEFERLVTDAGVEHFTSLRPGYFMENTLAQIGSILESGRMYTTLPAGTRFPMIATRDIGLRAAEVLMDGGQGHRVVELHGVPEFGYDEVAEVLSRELGRGVEHVTIPAEAYTEALTGAGASPAYAEALVELGEAMTAGRVTFLEPLRAADAATTDYAAFAREVFRPAFEAAQG